MNDRELDDKLAQFTDQVLKGQFQRGQEVDLTPEEKLVLKLQRVVRSDAPLDPAFRQRLTRSINDEWEQSRRKRTTSTHRVVPFRLTPRTLSVMAAAVVVILIGGIALLNNTGGSSSEPLGGTAIGTTELFIGLVVAGLIVAAGYWFWNRRS